MPLTYNNLPAMPRTHGLFIRPLLNTPNPAGDDPAAPDPKPDPKPADSPPVPKPDSDDEVERRVQARLAAERDKDRKAAERKAADDKRKADEAQGKWEEAAKAADAAKEAAEAERDAARVELKRERMVNRLTAYLAAHHAPYVGAADEMAMGIQVDAGTTDETLDKRIKERVEAFVKKLPLAPPGGTPKPPGNDRLPSDQEAPPANPRANGVKAPPVLTGAASFM
jgi:hypothetical protein